MTLESWNSIFLASLVGLAGLTLLALGGALVTSSRLNARQTERLRLLESAIASSEVRVSEARARVAEADARAAEAHEHAAANEVKAAELSKLLEDERNARTTPARQAANRPRPLNPDQFNAIASEMSRFSRQAAEIVVFPVNFESTGIANLIASVLTNAKWQVGTVQYLTEPARVPINASGAPGAMLIQGLYVRATGDEASQAAGRALFDALAATVASGIWDPGSLPGPPRVFVLVGDKPTAAGSWVRE